MQLSYRWRLSRHAWALILLALSACGPSVSLEKGYSQGEYHITSFAIEPASADLGADPEYLEAKKLLTKKLKDSLEGYEDGPEIGMTISITDVSLQINTARTLLIGDNYRIVADVTLWNPKDSTRVGRLSLGVKTGDAGGLVGLAVNASRDETQYKHLIVDNFAAKLLQTIYKKESH